jgi:hypothetical protein
MTKKSVQALLEDIRFVSEKNYEIVEAVRALVKNTFETTSEEVKKKSSMAGSCLHQASSLVASSPTNHTSLSNSGTAQKSMTLSGILKGQARDVDTSSW